jgi:hypothetical protein
MRLRRSSFLAAAALTAAGAMCGQRAPICRKGRFLTRRFLRSSTRRLQISQIPRTTNRSWRSTWR